MGQHIEIAKGSMYEMAGDRLRASLDGACRRLEDDMSQMVQDVSELLGSSYRTVIIGTDAIEASQAARSRLQEILQDADEKFVDAFDADVKLEADEHQTGTGRAGSDSDDGDDDDEDDGDGDDGVSIAS